MAASSTVPAEKPAYSPGLEGVIAGESAICSLDSEAGLRYRGYDIYDLATQATFPEIVYLLIHGELPTKQQLDALQKTIATERVLPEPVSKMLRLLPTSAHPMDA